MSTAELTPLAEQSTASVRVAGVRADEQVARSVLEARAVGFAFTRLGVQARPELAWRCEKLGTAILSALADVFPETER